jgi:hypothetical protein
MSTGAVIIMVLVLSVVWGGVSAALIMAIRQERRRKVKKEGQVRGPAPT